MHCSKLDYKLFKYKNMSTIIDHNYELIKNFLVENNVEFKEDYIDKKCKVVIDLWVPKYRIAIRKAAGDDTDQEFYKAICKCYKPYYIRETDTDDFTMEKIGNVLVERVQWLQKQYDKQQRKAALKKAEKEKKAAERAALGLPPIPEKKPYQKKPYNKNYQKRNYNNNGNGYYQRNNNNNYYNNRNNDNNNNNNAQAPVKRKRQRIVRSEAVSIAPKRDNGISTSRDGINFE